MRGQFHPAHTPTVRLTGGPVRMAAAVVIILFGLTGVLAAETVTDWGGFLDSSSELQYDGGQEFEQELKVGLWMDSAFSESLSLEVRGSYWYTGDHPLFASLDRLVFRGEFIEEGGDGGSRLVLRAGRLSLSEFTGYLFDHRLDGFDLRLDIPGLSLTAGAGYSGLAFVPDNTILVTGSDLAVQADAPDSGYSLAPPKLIERAEATFPQLLLQQDVTLTLVAQQDLQPTENLTASGDRIHTEYLGLGISGSAAAGLFHRLYGYLGYGHGAYRTVAYLAGGRISYYLEEAVFSRFTLRGLYSSGDAGQSSYYGGYTGGGSSAHFIPLSHRQEQFGVVFSPSPGNLAVGELSYSLKPFAGSRRRGGDALQAALHAMSFLRPTAGAISAAGVNPSSEEHYLGSEVDLRLSYRPFSDLGITLAGGLFFPNNGDADSAMDPSGEAVQAAGRLEISFRY